MRVSVVALSLVALAGCRGRFAFNCAGDSSQCVRNGAHGQCRPSPVDDESYCVFDDAACAQGRWDATAAAALAGLCVGEEMLDMAAGGGDGGGADFSAAPGADLSNLDASINLGGCTTANSLYSVWGASQDDIWAVGAGGTILHFRGAAPCEAQNSGSSNLLRGVWGRSANDVYVVGENGTLLHSTDKGATWMPDVSGVSVDHDFWAVAGTATTTYAAVEKFGTPKVDDGALFSSPTADGTHWTDSSPTLKAVTGMSSITPLDAFWASGNELWVGGGGGEAFHLSGGNWTHNSGPPSTSGYLSGFASISSRLLASSSGGEIWRLDGSTWTRAFDDAARMICENGVLSIFAVPGRVYAVGSAGCIAVSADDGVTWRAFDYSHPLGGPNNMYNDNYNGVWIDPVSQLVVLVGESGVVRQNPATP